MNRVWIAIYTFYDNTEVLGVFLSKEIALSYVKKDMLDRYGNVDFDITFQKYYYIQEYPIIEKPYE